MPAFKDVLNDDDLAAVLNHERTSWGNEAPTVRGADVARLRK
jgi:cytochrome c oxidase cbb3-type subunit 2